MSKAEAASKAAKDRELMPPPPLPEAKPPKSPGPKVSDAEQAELDFTIPLMHEQDPHHIAAISILSKDEVACHGSWTAHHRVEADGTITDTGKLRELLSGEYSNVRRIKMHFDFFDTLEEFGTKEQIDRALSIVIPVADRAEFCISVEFHEDAGAETTAAAARQTKDCNEFVKKRLMELMKKRWSDVGSKLAGNGDAKVRLDEDGAWGYGRRVEIISWL